MLAFIQNLSIGETLVIAVIAVLVFGKNLPEVAGRVFAQVRKVRRTVEEMRRETGIDRDLHQFRKSLRDIQQEADIADPLRRAAQGPFPDHRPGLEALPEPAAESTGDAKTAEQEPVCTPGPVLGQPMEDPARGQEAAPDPPERDPPLPDAD